MQFWIAQHAALIGYSLLGVVALVALVWGVRSWRKSRRPNMIEVVFSAEKEVRFDFNEKELTWSDWNVDMKRVSEGGMPVQDFIEKWSGKLPKRPEKKKPELQKDPWLYQSHGTFGTAAGVLTNAAWRFQDNSGPFAPQLFDPRSTQVANRLIVTAACFPNSPGSLALWNTFCRDQINKCGGTWVLEKDEQSRWTPDRVTLTREYVRIIPVDQKGRG